MSDWLLAFILGIVEGLTEFIPVSSTGHLLIADHALHIARGSFLREDLFNVVIQSGAVLAVIPLFRERLAMLARWREPASQTLLAKIIVAFFITGVGGLALDHLNFKLPEEMKPIALALLIGGIIFIVVETLLRGRPGATEISWTVAVAIGLAQLLAVGFPGASRSGSTIIIALLLGAARPTATEFSFLVGIPTMLAASAWKIFKEFHHHASPAMPPEGGLGLEAHHVVTGHEWSLLAFTWVVAAIVSFVAVKWLLRYVQTHTFICFGIYRIVLGAVLLAFAWHAQ